MNKPPMSEESSLPSLSAVADGVATHAELDEVLSAWQRVPVIQAQWAAYHVTGAVMRSANAVASNEVPDSAFLERFRARLATEPVVLAPAAANAVSAQQAVKRSASSKFRQPGRWAAPAAAAACVAVVATMFQQVFVPTESGGSMVATAQRPMSAFSGGTLVSSSEPASFNRFARPNIVADDVAAVREAMLEEAWRNRSLDVPRDTFAGYGGAAVRQVAYESP